MPVFDTHAHYDSGGFQADRDEILAALPAAGVGLVVDPGCDLEPSISAQATTAVRITLSGTTAISPIKVPVTSRSIVRRTARNTDIMISGLACPRHGLTCRPIAIGAVRHRPLPRGVRLRAGVRSTPSSE